MSLLVMARAMGKAIQDSPEYKRMAAARAANDRDEELQSGIEEFEMARVRLSAATQAEQQDPARIDELDRELKDIYEKVMSNENMKEYNDAKQEVDHLMNGISTILSASVNGGDPDTCEAHPHSCGGSCSGCAGCN